MMKRISGRRPAKRLRRQLQLLRSIIPPRPDSRSSCVVLDALHYMEDMRNEIRELDSFVQATSIRLQECLQANRLPIHSFEHDRGQVQADESNVEVFSTETGLEIHLSCDRTPGLLLAITKALEDLGLVFEKVAIQCRDRLTFDAFGAKNHEGALVDPESLRTLLRCLVLEYGGFFTITLEHSSLACGA